MYQERFSLTDWAGNVQEVFRSVLIQFNGTLTEGFSCIPVIDEGESQVCVSGRIHKIRSQPTAFSVILQFYSALIKQLFPPLRICIIRR